MNSLALIQRWSLYLFAFSINFEMWDPFDTGGNFSVARLTGLLYFVTVIPEIRKFGQTRRLESVLYPLWALFALLTVMNILNINTVSHPVLDLSLLQGIVLLWFLANHQSQSTHVLQKGLLSFACGSVVLAILFWAGIGVEYVEQRATLFGDNQNTIGMRMSISLVALSLLVLQNDLNMGKWRFLLLLPVPIMLRLMAESGSRVAFISFALSVVTSVVLWKTAKVWKKVVVLAVGTAVSFAMWQFLFKSDVMLNRLVRSIERNDMSGRNRIWEKVVPLIEENAAIGIGQTGYANFCQTAFGGWYSPHNVILEVLIYTGFIGLALYLIFLFNVVRGGVRAYRANGALLPLVLFIPMLGMILSAQILTQKIAWFLFAFIVSHYIATGNGMRSRTGFRQGMASNGRSHDGAAHKTAGPGRALKDVS